MQSIIIPKTTQVNFFFRHVSYTFLSIFICWLRHNIDFHYKNEKNGLNDFNRAPSPKLYKKEFYIFKICILPSVFPIVLSMNFCPWQSVPSFHHPNPLCKPCNKWHTLIISFQHLYQYSYHENLSIWKGWLSCF